MTSPGRPSVRNWAKRRSIRFTAAPSTRATKNPLAGACPGHPRLQRWSGKRRGSPGQAWPRGIYRQGSQLHPEMVGDGEDVLVAAAAHVHHHQMVAREIRRDLGDMGEGVRRLQRRNDPLLPAAQLKRVESLT